MGLKHGKNVRRLHADALMAATESPHRKRWNSCAPRVRHGCDDWLKRQVRTWRCDESLHAACLHCEGRMARAVHFIACIVAAAVLGLAAAGSINDVEHIVIWMQGV